MSARQGSRGATSEFTVQRAGDLPVTESLSQRIIGLPMANDIGAGSLGGTEVRLLVPSRAARARIGMAAAAPPAAPAPAPAVPEPELAIPEPEPVPAA